MRGEAFWGLKNPENPGASGGSAPWTPAGALPLDPTRALERAPGPHAVKTLRSLRSTWTETIFLQHPAVTNPAHAHGYGGWLPPESVLSRHLEKYLHDMDLKLSEHVRHTIFLFYRQKHRVKFQHLELFLAKKSILANISLKLDIFRSAMFYYVIVTSYIGRFL